MDKIRGCPWMTKIDSIYQFSDGLYPGWHPGQAIFPNTWGRARWSNGSHKIEDENWWQNTLVGDMDFSPGKLFSTGYNPESNGAFSRMNNKLRYNTTAFVGAYTNSSDFENNTFTYPSDSRSSFLRDAIGFACISNIKGSHSDSGGSSQAIMEKVALFYAHPTTRKRYMHICETKVTGTINKNSLYPNHSNYYYMYRISDAGISDVKDNKLVLMGMGFQTVHDGKSMSRDSQINLNNMRILIGNGTGFVNNQYTNRIMLVKNSGTFFRDIDSDASYSYS